jgi:His-Xaa-Ser system protein HxsD
MTDVPIGVSIDVDLAVYPLETVLRACHPFTARFHITPRMNGSGVTVTFTPRNEETPPGGLQGEFANALLDARLRALIAAETKTIRELIVAQAFCEADLLDRRDVESDEWADPRGIVRSRSADEGR